MDKTCQVRVIVSFRFRSAVSTNIYVRFTDLVHEALKQPGCLAFDILEDIHDPESYSLISLWTNLEANIQYTQTPHFKDYATFMSTNVRDLHVKTLRHIL